MSMHPWYNFSMSASEKTAILERVFQPADHTMTPEVARWMIGLRADGDLQSRFDELADRNTEDTITNEELDEYDEYLLVSRLVAVLQAKARDVLAQTNGH